MFLVGTLLVGALRGLQSVPSGTDRWKNKYSYKMGPYNCYRWSYGAPSKWPYEWVTGDITFRSGVAWAPYWWLVGRCPSCTKRRPLRVILSWLQAGWERWMWSRWRKVSPIFSPGRLEDAANVTMIHQPPRLLWLGSRYQRRSALSRVRLT